MKKNTRRKFIAGTVPAVALAAASAEARQGSATQPARKRVYRKLTPTSKTFNGQPLYSPELSFGNLVFVSGKGAGVDAKGDITEQTKTVLDQIGDEQGLHQPVRCRAPGTDHRRRDGSSGRLARRDRLHRSYLKRVSCQFPRASRRFRLATSSGY
jgi:hypothetical protein